MSRTVPTSDGVMKSSVVIALAVSCLVGCVHQLPPAATPDAVAPAVQVPQPPPEGRGRLVIDVVDGPTQVHRVTMQATPDDADKDFPRYRLSEAAEVLCSAPCVADLPVGNVLLGFPVLGDPAALETELVHVGAEPSVYRRALSRYEPGPQGALVLGILAAVFGGSSAITGAVLLPIGLAKDNDGMTLAGGITLGAGAALIALGVWGISAGSGTYQPGSSVHFSFDGP